jgi:hypothetical protein
VNSVELRGEGEERKSRVTGPRVKGGSEGRRNEWWECRAGEGRDKIGVEKGEGQRSEGRE